MWIVAIDDLHHRIVPFTLIPSVIGLPLLAEYQLVLGTLYNHILTAVFGLAGREL